MSSLSTNEKQVLEKLFQMSSGYVLNFTDRRFAEFFKDDVNVDIYDQKYNYASGSKANRMRGFWQVATDPLLGRSIERLVGYMETQILLENLKRDQFPEELIRRGHDIAARMLGNTASSVATESEFLMREFGAVSIDN
jgi:hypothetical protein